MAVGAFEAAPGAKVIDVTGMVVAPGFIDLHSHSDGVILDAGNRGNLNFLTQGVTTVVTGNCGGGPLDVAEYLDAVDDARGGDERHPPDPARGRAVVGHRQRRPRPTEPSWSG